MKTKAIFLTVMISLLGLATVFGQSKTEDLKVLGKCGMCKTRIEKAAKSVDGVIAADWNKQSEILEVTYDTTKTSTKDIQTAIAAVGHDTEAVKAKDDVYNALPACCKYERKPLGDSKKTK